MTQILVVSQAKARTDATRVSRDKDLLSGSCFDENWHLGTALSLIVCPKHDQIEDPTHLGSRQRVNNVASPGTSGHLVAFPLSLRTEMSVSVAREVLAG